MVDAVTPGYVFARDLVGRATYYINPSMLLPGLALAVGGDVVRLSYDPAEPVPPGRKPRGRDVQLVQRREG